MFNKIKEHVREHEVGLATALSTATAGMVAVAIISRISAVMTNDPVETYDCNMRCTVWEYDGESSYEEIQSDLDKNILHSKTEYFIAVEFPDLLLAEIENGHSNYQVDVKYSFQVSDGERGVIQMRIFNPDNNRLYIARREFWATGDLCLKHSTGQMATRMANLDECAGFYENRGVAGFMVYTSALPDDSVKSTEFDSTIATWHLEGVEGEF